MQIVLPQKRRVVRGNRAFAPKKEPITPRKWSNQMLRNHLRKYGFEGTAEKLGVSASKLWAYLRTYEVVSRPVRLTAEQIADIVEKYGWRVFGKKHPLPRTHIAAAKDVLAQREAVQKQNERISAALRRALPYLDSDDQTR